jgi:hypothetical protein
LWFRDRWTVKEAKAKHLLKAGVRVRRHRILNSMPDVGCRMFLVGALLFLSCVPMRAEADPLKLQFTSGLEEKYTDNVFFDARDPQADLITHVSPELLAGWQAEVTSLRITSRADIYHYMEYDGLDAVDQSYSGQLDHRWSPRLSTSLTAGYLIDETRDRELSETGLLFNDDRRYQQTCGFNGQYQLSERSAVSLAYNYRRDDYDDPLTYDLTVHLARMLYSSSLAPFLERVTGRLQLVGGLYEYRRDYDAVAYLYGIFPFDSTVEDTQTVDYYSATIGMAYNWTERLQLTVDLGTRYSRTKQRVSTSIAPNPFVSGYPPVRAQNESWGYVGLLEAVYAFEKGRLSLTASHDLQPASGQEGATERTSLRLAGENRVTDRWYFSWSAQGYLNRSDEGAVLSDEDELTIQLEAGLRYAFNRQWNIGAYGRTIRIDDRERDSERIQNSMMVRLGLNWPILE